ncbi:MAG TPA: Hsp70 family protein [Anaerolineaceae bacterium]|nr:Hsp70 family protein [Anaerolineaceae bacterium]HQP61131.1 Hsp70 family protein [Anaerolineaceae bacterium]
MPASIGIDIGSTCLRLAAMRDGKPQPLGTPIPLWQAAGLQHDPGPEQGLKPRLLGDQPVTLAGRTLPPEELALRLLVHARQAAAGFLHESVEGCAMTVDSQTSSLVRNRLREASRTAGFSTARLVNETSAIALSQSNPAETATILVYSLGADSLEVLVAERAPGALTALANGACNSLSGQQFTNQLARHIHEQARFQVEGSLLSQPRALAAITAEAERIKLLLSRDTEAEIHLTELAGQAVDFQLLMTRQAFEELAERYFQEGLDLCNQLLADLRLSPSDLGEVWLAGGSTSIPFVQRRMAEWYGRQPRLAGEYAAALGAAIQAQSTTAPMPTPAAEERPAGLPDFSSTPVPVDASPLVERWVEAHRLEQEHDYSGALAQLGKINQVLESRKAHIRYLQAQAYEAEGDLRQAMVFYRLANRLDRANSEYAAAITRLEKLEARHLFAEGYRMEQAGDLAKSMEIYQHARQLDPDQPDYIRACARVLSAAGERLIERARQFSGSKATVYFRDALKYYREALNYAPGDAMIKHRIRQLEDFLKKRH